MHGRSIPFHPRLRKEKPVEFTCDHTSICMVRPMDSLFAILSCAETCFLSDRWGLMVAGLAWYLSVWAGLVWLDPRFGTSVKDDEGMIVYAGVFVIIHRQPKVCIKYASICFIYLHLLGIPFQSAQICWATARNTNEHQNHPESFITRIYQRWPMVTPYDTIWLWLALYKMRGGDPMHAYSSIGAFD